MAVGTRLVEPVIVEPDQKHWLTRHAMVRRVLLGLAFAVVALASFELGHWLQSGMGFWEHQGHLLEHFRSLLSGNGWEPSDDMGRIMWFRAPARIMWVRWG